MPCSSNFKMRLLYLILPKFPSSKADRNVNLCNTQQPTRKNEHLTGCQFSLDPLHIPYNNHEDLVWGLAILETVSFSMRTEPMVKCFGVMNRIF